MLYVSRQVGKDKYGIVDTDDDVENLVSSSDILNSGLKIAGAKGKSINPIICRQYDLDFKVVEVNLDSYNGQDWGYCVVEVIPDDKFVKMLKYTMPNEKDFCLMCDVTIMYGHIWEFISTMESINFDRFHSVYTITSSNYASYVPYEIGYAGDTRRKLESVVMSAIQKKYRELGLYSLWGYGFDKQLKLVGDNKINYKGIEMGILRFENIVKQEFQKARGNGLDRDAQIEEILPLLRLDGIFNM